MCGIAGEIRFDGAMADSEAVRAMTQAQQRRGPDGAGLYQQGPVALGHRRLRIIDLSAHGAQPMQDNTLGLTLVFNGCIYNYVQLREQLQQKGYSFFSSSDTEVIIKAYHHWGVECVQQFKGMFAFAIVERDSGRVFLARDRSGIKPLYYHHTASAFHFASSLPALLQSGAVDMAIDPKALHYYLMFHGIIPAPESLFQSVKKLPQGHWMMLEPDGSVKMERYWQVHFCPEPEGDEEEWKSRLLDKLDVAVQRRLVADVPVGVLLSGGIDSSLMVALCAKHSATPVKTFSIGFEDAGGEAGNEFYYSDMVAKHYGSEHRKIFIPQEDVIKHLPDCIANMSEPMVSWDNIGFYLLAREVSQHIKVVQCGQGADELFAGYGWHAPLLASHNPRDDFKKGWFDRSFAEYARMVHPDLVEENYAEAFIDDYYRESRAGSEFEKGLELDTTVLITDDPVKRVDNHTMAWGLEARVPFLDHEVVEFAATIPTAYKIRNGVGKWLLKEASRQLLPAEVIDRPKGYFPVPALKNLSGPTLEFMRETVMAQHCRNRGLVNADYVVQLVENPQAHLTPTGVSKLYQLAVLEHWLHIHAPQAYFGSSRKEPLRQAS